MERVAQTVDCRAGTVIFRRGDKGSQFYLILEGQVEFFVEGRTRAASQRVTVVDTFGPGETFGELALCGAPTRTLGARAKTDVSLRVLERDDLLALIDAEPGIAVALLETSARRIAQLRDQLYGKPPGLLQA